jgi:hypothetical protein
VLDFNYTDHLANDEVLLKITANERRESESTYAEKDPNHIQLSSKKLIVQSSTSQDFESHTTA